MRNDLYLYAAVFGMCVMPAKAEDLLCPPAIKIESASLSEVPAGWTKEVSGSRLKVIAAGFYSGPPSEMAELKPDSLTGKNGVTRDRWVFRPATPHEEIWLSCDYERRVVSLAKKIPKDIVECAVQYKDRKGVLAFEGISCKTE